MSKRSRVRGTPALKSRLRKASLGIDEFDCLCLPSVTSISTAPLSAPAQRVELLFVDARVSAELGVELASRPNVSRVVSIGANEDGVEAITSVLASYQQVDAVHILSHATAGGVQLGNTWLDDASARVYKQQMMRWGQALADHGDLLFYGCELARGQAGEGLLKQIAAWTGADVAANNDRTGMAALGGDWDLDYHLGAIESQVLVASDWHGVLATPIPIGAEFSVNTFLQGDQATTDSNAVALDSGGNFVVVWTSANQDGDGKGIYAQRFDASGAKLGGEFRVNTTTVKDQANPAVVMSGTGEFVVTWQSQDQDGDRTGIYARRFDAAGIAVGNEFRVNTTTVKEQQDPDIAMDALGNYVVVWSSKDQDGDNFGIYGQRFNAAGSAVGAEFRVNTYTEKEQLDASAAMDSAGNFVITWSSRDQDGDKWGIYGQRFDANGARIGGEFRVNTTITGEQLSSAVAMDTTGNFVVAWTSNQQDGNNRGVFARRFDAGGNALSGEFLVNSQIIRDQKSPSVGMSPSGDFTIVWESKDQDGDKLGIYAQSYDALGTSLGPEFLVNSTTSGDQKLPSVARNAQGQMVVVWSGKGTQDGSGVFGQLYQSVGILVGAPSTPITTEAGEVATFSVVLATQPTADVTVSVSSSLPTEGGVSIALLTFTTANWNVPQFVTVTGVDDATPDGDAAYTVILSPAVSADPNYDGIDPTDILLTNLDNDSPEIFVSPTTGLITNESAVADRFLVVLTSQPLADVSIPILISNSSEGTVSTSLLTFTPADWDIAQIVVVTGVDDFTSDGPVTYQIITGPAVSTDPAFDGLDPSDVSVTNYDDDVAGIAVSPISGPTSEPNGQATFTVVLNSQPISDVTIGLSSSDTTEGTLSVSSITFTPANWNVAQVVQVTGADDVASDGDVPYAIVTAPSVSADPSYANLDPDDVDVVNRDNDVAGIIVSALALVTSEGGDSVSFTVRLNSAPLLPVTIGVSSSDPSEGVVSTSSLTFTLFDWNLPRTVTVTGVDDAIDDGDVVFTVILAPAVGLDLFYAGNDAADVLVTNLDDDVAGIAVTPVSGTTTEAGGQSSFTVALTSEPTSSVVIDIASSNPGEGVASRSSLTFTPADWSMPQTVLVAGVDDFVADGDAAYQIRLTASSLFDASYSGIVPRDVMLINLDDDVPGIVVSPLSGSTSEGGAQASFSVVLTSQPTADVAINLVSSNAFEGATTAASLTFTPANWNIPQGVTVVGVDDTLVDGDAAYMIQLLQPVSSDTIYAALAGVDVSAVNLDNDVATSDSTPESDPPPVLIAPQLPAEGSSGDEAPMVPPVNDDVLDAVPFLPATQHEGALPNDVVQPGQLFGGNYATEPPVVESALPEQTPEPREPAFVAPHVSVMPLPTLPAPPAPPAVLSPAPTTPVSPPPSVAPGPAPVRPPAITPDQRRAQTAAQTALFQEYLAPAQEEQTVLRQARTTVLTAGFVVAAGYALISTRLASWLLLLLMSRPMWTQFDPLEILFAWNNEKQRKKGDNDETLQSLVARGEDARA